MATPSLIRRRGLAASASALALASASPALGQALPAGGVVTVGAASVQSAGGVLTVTQTTARADLNWQTFDIGAGGRVVFAQPSSSAVAVNRVLSGGPSAILGSLESNGRVFLLNPNGVVFGQGAQVNVGGLVAAAGELSGDPQGRFQITAARAGVVSNAGRITAGGGVLLAGERVMNAASGAIRGGSVTLAAGGQASVALDAGGLVRLQVDQSALDAAAGNQGVIVAPGGEVLLTAQGVAAAVEAGGRISAEDGAIALDAGPNGRVAAVGALAVTSASGKGGRITVLGGEIAVGASARLDVSGETGGGTILVGGGARGRGQPYNARRVHVAEGAAFSADADVLGDGGTIVVWADGQADVTGRFSARGGREGGQGGFVETSGHDDLHIGDATTVNTLSPRGKAGDWLLDPTTITTGTGTGTLADAAGGSSGAVTIKASTINAATSNVILAASTSITVNAPSNINIAAAGVGITFQGLTPGSAPSNGTILNGNVGTNGGDIVINGPVTLYRNATLTAGAGSLTVTGAIDSNGAGVYGLTTSVSGSGVATFGGPIGATSALGAFTSTGTTALAADVTTAGAISLGSLTLNSDVTLNAGAGNVTISNDVNSAAGQSYALSLSGTGAATFGGAVGNSVKLKSLSTAATLSQVNFTGGGATISTADGPITLAGGVTVSGASASFNAGSGTVTFGGGVNSGSANSNTLKVNYDAGNTGPVVFSSGAGAVSAFNQILVGAPSNPGLLSLAGTVSAYDAFTVRGAVTLTGAVAATSGATTFAGAINGAFGLILTARAGGAIALQGDIGTVTPLADLTMHTQGGLGHTISGAVITTGDQTYRDSGTVNLGSGAALISTAGNLSIPATLASAGASAVVLGAGYSGYDPVTRTLSTATSGASASRIDLSGGFTSTNSTPLTVYARDIVTVTGGLGGAAAPLGMLSFTAPTVTLGASGQPNDIHGSAGLLITGAPTVYGGGTWSLAGSNASTSRGVEVSGDLTVFGALTVAAAKDMQFAGVLAGTTDVSLTVTGSGGATPTFKATGVAQNGTYLSSVTFNTPVSVGGVNTTGAQTYAMGGAFSGAYVSTAGSISLTADRNAGRYITLAGTSRVTANAATLAGTVISSGGYGLTLSAPSLALGQAILGDGTLGVIGDLSITSTGPVSFGSSAHAVSGTFSANVSGALTFRNSRAFSLGAISTSVTTARISSDTGDIVVIGQVTPSGDLTLVAGEDGRRAAFGQADTGGNIQIGGGGVTVTSGARGLLYSGSLTTSTGLAGLVGSGRSRYYIDTVNSYADATGVPSGTGLYALYREQPSASITGAPSDGVTTYDGKPHAATLSVSGLMMGDTVSIGTVSITDGSGQSVASVTGAGTYAVSASGSPALTLGGLGYAVTQNTSFTLARAPLTLTYTANAASSVYGQALAALSGSVSGSGFVNGETVAALSGTAAWSTTATAGASVGTYGVTGSGLSSANYTITAAQAGGNRAAYAITPAPLTITGATTSLTYSGATRTNTYGVSGLVGGDTVTSVSGLATGVAVGTYSDTLSGALGTGLGNYSIAYVNGGLTIGKASLTITGATTARTYSGVAQTNSFSARGLFGSDAVAAVSGLATGTNAGGYTDTLSDATGSGLGNYDISYVNGGLTITKAPLTITGATASRSATGASQTNTYSITAGQLFGSDRIDSVSGLAVGVTAGTYADSLTAAAGLGLDNYQITFVNGALTLLAAGSRPSLTITGGTTVLTYNGRLQTNTFSVSGLTGGDTVTGVSGLASGTGAGTYLDSLSNATGSGLGNYDIRYINGRLTIDPATLTLTYAANAVTSVYGRPLAALSGSVSGAGFVNGETVAALGGSATWSTTATSMSSVATYAVTGGGLTSTNYRITAVQAGGNGAAYAITRAPLTITGAARSVLYAGQAQFNTFSVTGLAGGDRVDGVSGLAFGTNAGTYRDTLSGAVGRGLQNYDIAYVNGSLSITRAPLTITGGTASRTYSGIVQTNGFTVSGLMGRDTVSAVSGLATGLGVGAYADHLSGATGSGLENYAITYADGQLIIERAPLTLTYTASPVSTVYGDPIAPVSGMVTGSGFMGGEGVSVLGGAAIWTTPVVAGGAAGTYAITGGGLTAANYRIEARQAAGNATAYAVTPRPIEGVTGVSVADKLFDGTLTAAADVRGAVLGGVLPGDMVRLAPVTAAFATPGPGVAIPVTIMLNGLTGAAAGNYTLASSTLAGSAAIIPRQTPTPAALYSGVAALRSAVNLEPPSAPDPVRPVVDLMGAGSGASPALEAPEGAAGGPLAGSSQPAAISCARVNGESVCQQVIPREGYRLGLAQTWRLR